MENTYKARHQKVELWIVRGSFDRAVKRQLRTRTVAPHESEVFVIYQGKDYPLKTLTPIVTTLGSLAYILKVAP